MVRSLSAVWAALSSVLTLVPLPLFSPSHDHFELEKSWGVYSPYHAVEDYTPLPAGCEISQVTPAPYPQIVGLLTPWTRLTLSVISAELHNFRCGAQSSYYSYTDMALDSRLPARPRISSPASSSCRVPNTIPTLVWISWIRLSTPWRKISLCL